MSLWRHVRLVYILWLPLERASGALHKFPLIAEQHIKIAIVPFDRVWRPCAFDAAGDRVIAMANTELALPPKPLFGDVAAFRLCTNHRRVTRTVALAKCVTASSQRNSFFVVHGHPGKCFTDVLCRSQRIRIAVRAFGVHVDEAHLNGCERVLEHTLAAIAAAGLIAGGQPLFFRAPIDIFLRLENVFAAAAKPKRFTAHGFNGAIARKDHEIGPGNLVAVLLLDRPQQTAGLVEIGIVRPAVQRRKALRPGSRSTPAVTCAICTGAVPGHTDEERTIMAVVRRPPILGIRHQREDVLFDRLQVEFLEFLGILERLAKWITDRRVLVKDAEV